jgi:hypothetical protein
MPFAVNWLQWHFKLWYLFSGAIYNQGQSKKHAVPFQIRSLLIVFTKIWTILSLSLLRLDALTTMEQCIIDTNACRQQS